MSGSQSTVSYSLCVGVDIAATTATVAWMRPGEKVCRPVIIEQTPPAWVPRHVVDDGKKLYIVYPEVTLFESVPFLRLIGPNGPQLVNSRQYLNVVIVDQLVARAELRVGVGERAQTVTITRGNLRTITCPGDEACPVWPRAAAVLAGRRS